MKKEKEKTEDEIQDENIAENPEKYLEINIIKKDKFRMVDTIYKYIKDETFKYGEPEKEYNIDSKCIFLTPYKKSFMPTSFYIEGHKKPLEFVNNNKNIPCNALSLLWKYKLYKVLMELEEKNINFILIVLLIASMVMYGVSLYFKYGGTL